MENPDADDKHVDCHMNIFFDMLVTNIILSVEWDE